jgi:hypothetical protein
VTVADRKSLRDRIRPYFLGAASIFDLSGMLAYRAAREAMPPADDWKAVGDHFREAGRLLRETMPGQPEPGNPVAGEREDNSDGT